MIWDYNMCPQVGEALSGQTLDMCMNKCSLNDTCTAFNYRWGNGPSGSRCELLNCPTSAPQSTYNYMKGWKEDTSSKGKNFSS